MASGCIGHKLLITCVHCLSGLNEIYTYKKMIAACNV